MSLRARLLAAFAYTLVVVMVALEVPLGRNLGERVNAEVEDEASAQAQVVAAQASSQRLAPSPALDRLVVRKAAELGGRVLILDGSGRVVADSEEVAVGTRYATGQRPELLEALAGRVAQGRRHSDTLDQELLLTAVPVVRGDRTQGAVRVAHSVDDVNAAVRDDVLALVWVGVLALMLGLGVAWILAGSISRPIQALAGTARRMAAGDLEARAEPQGSREQVELGRAFNEMADRVGSLLESQRAFVADASHQLRTPLTGLRLRLEAAAEAAGEPDAARQLAAAERETERLSDLVDDLLTLAASEQPLEAEPAELGAATASAAERWGEPARRAGHELVIADRRPLLVLAPDGDLAVILDNLIENAINYSAPGSPVEVDWRARDGLATLWVSNRGEPLQEAELQRSFERFYRGRGERGAGTGLGLAIVAALARRSGGDARLRNGSGGRIAAEVDLPVADPTLPRSNQEGLRSSG